MIFLKPLINYWPHCAKRWIVSGLTCVESWSFMANFSPASPLSRLGLVYPLVMTNSFPFSMAIEIVSFPKKKMLIFHTHVCLPEGMKGNWHLKSQNILLERCSLETIQWLIDRTRWYVMINQSELYSPAIDWLIGWLIDLVWKTKNYYPMFAPRWA